MDNFALSIMHTARIINDLIPHYYDTSRTIRVLGQDGSQQRTPINQPQGFEVDGVPIDILSDMTTGSYDVQMEMGPSYATKREEARDGMTAFMQAFPPAAPLIGDLVAKAQDWPNSDEVSERLFHLLPPQFQAEIAQQTNDPSKMPPPPQQQPPNPVEMAKTQAEISKAQREQSRAEAEQSKVMHGMAAGEHKLKMQELELQGQQLKNVMAEFQLLDVQMKLASNGPPIDSAKLHTWIGHVDLALKSMDAHVASQIAATGPSGGQQGPSDDQSVDTNATIGAAAKGTETVNPEFVTV